MSPILLVATVLTLIPLEGGIFDKIGDLNTEALMTARVIAITAAVILIIVVAVASRFSVAKILTTILVAGLVLWGVWNITDVRDMVGKDLKASISLEGPVIPTTSPAAPTDSPSWA